MTEIDKNYRVVFAVNQIINYLPRIASLAALFTGFTYVIGWIQAKAYFNIIGASWLINEMTMISLLSFSWLPIALLGYILVLVILDISESDTAENWMLKTLQYSVPIYLVLITLGLVINLLKLKTILIFYSLILGFSTVLFAGCAFGILLSNLKDKDFKWNLLSTYLINSIILFGFYLAPTSIGKANAYSDINPSLSQLPIVELKLKNDYKDLRLLLNIEERYYLISLDGKDDYPNVLVIKRDDIKIIKNYKNKSEETHIVGLPSELNADSTSDSKTIPYNNSLNDSVVSQ